MTGADQAPALVAAGATLFTVGSGGPDYDLSGVAEAIRWRDEFNPESVAGIA